MTPDCTITARSSVETIAVAPYVIGFHPTDSIVVLGVDDDTVTFGVRYDLPPPDDDGTDMAVVVARQAVQRVFVLGYGPPDRVTPAVLQLTRSLSHLGVRVADAIRVTGGRWWSYFCGKPRCCPAEGHPCPPPDSVSAATAVFGGRVALPHRQALVAQVAPVGGEERSAMEAATDSAEKRLDDLSGDDHGGRSALRAGRSAVREAERGLRSGRALTADDVAWLGVLLADARVLDYALDRSGGEDWRVRLWTEVLRRVGPEFVAAPACLLAYAAWQQGNGALARVAIDRGLRADPRHHTVAMLDRLLRSGIGPQSLVALWPPGVRPRPRGPHDGAGAPGGRSRSGGGGTRAASPRPRRRGDGERQVWASGGAPGEGTPDEWDDGRRQTGGRRDYRRDRQRKPGRSKGAPRVPRRKM